MPKVKGRKARQTSSARPQTTERSMARTCAETRAMIHKSGNARRDIDSTIGSSRATLARSREVIDRVDRLLERSPR